MATKHKFTPNFSHRLSAMSGHHEVFSVDDLHDSIHLIADQAAAQVNLISLQFRGDEEQFNDEINLNALMAVENQLQDIGALLQAFSEYQKLNAKN